MSSGFIVVFKDSATQEQIEQYAEQVNGGGETIPDCHGVGSTAPDMMP